MVEPGPLFAWGAPAEPVVERAEYRVRVGSRRLRTTAVFDTYWRFAAERQAMFFRRLCGEWPVTSDSILAAHRFTNVFRASDRVSQYLIGAVIPGSASDDDVFFRVLLFKIFNRIETWERLSRDIGVPSLATYDRARYEAALDRMMADGATVYSSAYIMPTAPFGHARKHANHLSLLERMIGEQLPARLRAAASLQDAYIALLAYPSLGRFLAFQFAIDLNYSPLMAFSEAEFVVAGPGACDGIAKCFVDLDGASHADVIVATAEMAEREFARLELEFMPLWTRMPQLVDWQNVYCEVDKYARRAHPEARGLQHRTQIKQKYKRNPAPIALAYPAKWGLAGEVRGLPLPRAV